MKKLVIFITARKDSKRLKNKNILKLGSKKLVERTINFAKKLVTNNCIFLSTDSEIAKKTGAGIIVNNISEMSKAINKLFFDKKLNMKLSINGIKNSSKFSWKKIAMSYLKVFRSI